MVLHLLIVTLLFATVASDEVVHRHLVINDMHYNPNYTASCNFAFCQDIGTYGKDPGIDLIERVVNKTKDFVEPKAVFMLGDFILHNYEIDDDGKEWQTPGLSFEFKFEVVKNMWGNLTQTVRR